SAFVRPDSMSAGVRWFSEYQPFTPVIDTLRGLLLGTAIGNSAVLAVAWCVVLALVGYLWARAVYNRNSVRERFFVVFARFPLPAARLAAHAVQASIHYWLRESYR